MGHKAKYYGWQGTSVPIQTVPEFYMLQLTIALLVMKWPSVESLLDKGLLDGPV